MILNRPILYFVLYQGFEASESAEGMSMSRPLDPWVLHACLDCAKSARLIIAIVAERVSQIGDHSTAMSLGWYNCQLVVGSYAVLLSFQISPSLFSTVPLFTELNGALDQAEAVLSQAGKSSLAFGTILKALRNIRHNHQSQTLSPQSITRQIS
jgi:hypothetical protein